MSWVEIKDDSKYENNLNPTLFIVALLINSDQIGIRRQHGPVKLFEGSPLAYASKGVTLKCAYVIIISRSISA